MKYEKLTGSGIESSVKFEVFHPFTYQPLNLSYCDNTTVEVLIPIELDEEVENIYNNLLNQGYNLLDPDDSFYRDICTPYQSENGTDVLLDDRISYYYNKVYNDTTCPQNCQFMSYSPETKYLKCECTPNNTDIVTLDANNLSKENIIKSFYSTLKYSNWKVMICYNLVFNWKIFCHNYGSILSLILFIIYLIFMIYYASKEISPLKIEISKILFKESNLNEIKTTEFKPKLKEKNKKGKNKGKAPPKRVSVIRTKENEPKNTENFEFIEDDTKRKKIKHKTTNKMKRNIRMKEKRRSKKEKNIKEINIKIKPKKNNNEINDINENDIEEDNIEDINEIRTRDSTHELKRDKKILSDKQLDNYELNNLEYEEASELDNCGCCKTYWSVLLREHSALLTFVAWHDYNLFYVKIERFLILFCTDMTMNGLFFSDESMHHLYVNSGEYNFVQQLPQIILSLVVGHILEVILCFLSMTDSAIYEIKGLSKVEKSGEKIMDILDKMKNKLVAFFIFTFLLFLFYWYFISAFCAVYQNTQKIFIRDSLISFVTSMIDPFIIYGVTMVLRALSLSKCCKKKCGCVYKISDLIPIF